MDRIYALLVRIDEVIDGEKAPVKASEDTSFWKNFCDAMDDDFNSANGIAVIFNAVRHANRLIDENETDIITRSLMISLSVIKQDILRMGAVLGIGNDAPAAYFDVQRESVLAQATMDVKYIETLIAERKTARQEKNWQKADQVRDQLASMNIVLEDRPDGTKWKIKS